MTLEQLTEGVRRTLRWKYHWLPEVSDRYCSEHDARTIAEALAADSGLRAIRKHGGLNECASMEVFKDLPFQTPKSLQLLQRWGIGAMRLLFVDVWGWTSRYVDSPSGRIHIYDTGPALAGDGQPPLLLQHGLLVTGWSMALTAWLLSRRGRRVIVPDLFDIDHGLSASSSMEKVRKPEAFREALLCVLRALRREGCSDIDLAGHSFGGFMVALLQRSCQREGIKIRRLVLLSPSGGQFDRLPDPLLSRFLQDPMGTVEMLTPRWLPTSFLKAVTTCVLSVTFSPNNCNSLLDGSFREFIGFTELGAECPTLLLWGDRDNLATPRKPEHLGQFMTSHYPHLDAFWLRGAGHSIIIDAALSVAVTVDTWLRSPEAEVGRATWTPCASHWFWPTSRNVYKMELSATMATTAGPSTPPAVRCSRSRL